MRTSRTATSEEWRSHSHPPPSSGATITHTSRAMRSRRRRHTIPNTACPPPPARARAPVPPPHPPKHIRARCRAGFLDEVGVLGAEASAPHRQPATAGLREQEPGAASVGTRVLRILERRPKRLYALRLGFVALRAHLSQRRCHGRWICAAQQKCCARDDLAH